ncbi:MAG: hypothetical protein IJW78_04450 [Clostridia bacterium]|nr:hypothetical protein [Clostridia bacterium]
MDDMSTKIEALLNQPDAMEKLSQAAQALFGAENNAPAPQAPAGLPDVDIGAMMNIMGKLKNMGEDNRARLLLALKPHLSEKRQGRVDTAVKLLKLVSLAPLLKDQGIL